MIEAEAVNAELSLTHCMDVLLRRRRTFISVSSACILASILYVLVLRPVYQGATLVELAKPGGSEGIRPGGAIVPGDDDQYSQTEFRRFKTDTLDQKVYDDLHLERAKDFAAPGGLKKLQEAITINPVPRTHLAYVEVLSHEPKLAALISSTLSTYYVQDHINNALFMSRDVLKALNLSSPDVDKRLVYDSLPSVVDNHLIQTTKEQKIVLEGQLADLTMRYTSNHPQVIAATSRLAALNRIIDRETENVVNSLKAQLSGKFIANNVRVLDPARTPEKPIKPQKALVLALGLLEGLVLGLFGVAIADAMDQSIRSEEDVERKVREAFLGVVPYARQKPNAKVYEAMLTKDATLTSEAFRNLRTMVDFAGVDGRATPLLVTSSLQEEGKSFVAANLAVAFSQAGERVLLIEGDLRRPSVHKKFGLSTEHGICDFLAGGTQADLANLIQASGIPNLSVLTCGPRPPNPSELLNTPRVAALVAWADRTYDRVIVDCTPLYPISDALLWGRQIRSAVFVTRFAATRAPVIRSACGRLKKGGIKTLGVVINATRLGSLSYSGGYYEQYYRDYAQPKGAALKSS